MQIQARFRLDEVGRIKVYDASAKGYIEGVRVKLYPVQGEPFGSATPSGNLEMVIANQASAQVFRDAPLGAEFDALFSLHEE